MSFFGGRGGWVGWGEGGFGLDCGFDLTCVLIQDGVPDAAMARDVHQLQGLLTGYNQLSRVLLNT